MLRPSGKVTLTLVQDESRAPRAGPGAERGTRPEARPHVGERTSGCASELVAGDARARVPRRSHLLFLVVAPVILLTLALRKFKSTVNS